MKTPPPPPPCRCELVAQAASMKSSWLASVAQLQQLRAVREQLSRWRTYRSGLKLIGGLLGDLDCVLPPAGPLMITADDCQVGSNRLMKDNQRLLSH